MSGMQINGLYRGALLKENSSSMVLFSLRVTHPIASTFFFLQEGNRFDNFYNIDDCENWLDEEINRLESTRSRYELVANDSNQSKSVRKV
jgi:hypothetical protein